MHNYMFSGLFLFLFFYYFKKKYKKGFHFVGSRDVDNGCVVLFSNEANNVNYFIAMYFKKYAR